WQHAALDLIFRALKLVVYDAKTKSNLRDDVNIKASLVLGDLLEQAPPRPGTFLRLAAAPGSRGPAWSVLALPSRRRLAVGRWPGQLGLREALAPVAPRPVRCHGRRLPFVGGWVGLLGYEARSGVERSPAVRPSPLGFPALWLGWSEAAVLVEHATGQAFLAALGRDLAAARRRLGRLARWVERAAAAPARARDAGTARARPRMAASRYRRLVGRVRAHVRAGDIFQANLSQRFDAQGVGAPHALFRRLVAQQPAPYMTFLRLPGGRCVLSASPERFLALQGRRATTEPMKGTRPRGRTPREDRALVRDLRASEKDRAELAMIVDLSRNDLARACRPGSVRVTQPRLLLPFARVHQAIGVVQGELARGRTRVDLLAACFPPGSVTGAPKVRAMEVIDALEGEGRGPYCGALGWLDAGGDMDLAVAIRTLLVAGRRASYRVGGGITLRSQPAAEWRETLAKGRGLEAALSGRARP
ncbi:MAG: anthranilate synthase component I family protein, partial [Planctomycetia bacterium]